MIAEIASMLCDGARRILPASRRDWGDAMVAELSHLDDGRAALAFAGGCFAAAVRARLGDADTQANAGWWSIALATAYCAVDRLACAGRGMAVSMGAPDGMRDRLLRHGADAVLIGRYDLARPFVVACFVALGATQLTTAWFLSRGQLRSSIATGCAALAIACAAVAIQLAIVWSSEGIPSEFHASLTQAVAGPALVAWIHHRKRYSREKVG